MFEQPTIPTDETSNLLQDLKSDDRWVRERAAKKLGELGVKNDEIINALMEVAAHDRNPYPRKTARQALLKLGVSTAQLPQEPSTGKIYKTPQEKIIEFAVGFVGWFLLNGLLWYLVKPKMETYGGNVFVVWLCSLPTTLIVLVFALILRRWFGFGILSALALNLAITLVLQMTTNAMCLIPFFIKVNP